MIARAVAAAGAAAAAVSAGSVELLVQQDTVAQRPVTNPKFPKERC